MTKAVNTKTHTDIKRLAWVETSLPAPLRPYAYLMRIDRPIGVWLLLFPALWSITLSISDKVSYFDALWVVSLFTLGAFVMRGAGCVVNDLWDRDLDAQVERTRARPLASGAVTPFQAIVFLATLSFIGLFILLHFNSVTIFLGLLSLPLIILYPLMKRITWWPQAFLGITFNFGALMGWAAMNGDIGWPAVLLYCGGIFWTLGYDTIYAHQDTDDDALIGVKSTALYFKERSKAWVSGFYTLAAIFFLSAVFSVHGAWASLLCTPVMLHLLWQIKTWDSNSPQSALKIFKSNRDFAALFTLDLILMTLI